MIKWKNPKNGCCQYFDKNGYRYFIIDRLYSDGSISSCWHIERKRMIEPNRRRFESFWEMCLVLFGERPTTMGEDNESVAYWTIRSKTEYINCGNDYTRVYTANERHFAVNLQTKESWEYVVAETVSPDLDTVEECKRYAEENLFNEDTLF